MSQWKFGLVLEDCGACGRYDKVSEDERAQYSHALAAYDPSPDFNEASLDAGHELAKSGMIPYNCLNCNDFGERWRARDGRYFKITELPLHRPGTMLTDPVNTGYTSREGSPN